MVAEMAKQIEDKKTLELIEPPKRRGRPVTGNAKSSAERMKEMRERKKIRGCRTIELSENELRTLHISLITHIHTGSMSDEYLEKLIELHSRIDPIGKRSVQETLDQKQKSKQEKA